MSPTLIIAAVSALVSGLAGFALAWQLQGHQITKQKLEHTNERIAIQRTARATIERTTSAVIQAQNAATARIAVLRRDADAARAAADGLRNDLDAAVRFAATSADACNLAAATTAELLGVCGDSYRELAAKADGHVSDIKTLTEAWPK